MQKNLLI